MKTIAIVSRKGGAGKTTLAVHLSVPASSKGKETAIVGQRAAFVHSLTTGQTAQEYEPDGKAVEEIQQLYKWTWKQLNV